MTSVEFPKTVAGKKRIINVITILILFLAASFLIFGVRKGIFSSHEAMTAFLKRFGLLAPVVYILFIVFQSTFMVVPGAVGNLVGVVLFGPFWGIFCNYLGTIIGSSLNFGLSRIYGADVIRLFAPKNALAKYENWLEVDEYKFHKWFALCIFLPLAPDDLLCYLAGLTRMSFRKFILIILLGKPLAVTSYSLLLHLGFTNLMKVISW